MDDENAFGHPFCLESLPLPRPAAGYGVQWLNTDHLLDTLSGRFLPVRHPGLQGIFPSFAAARQAARAWLAEQNAPPAEHSLAIVPVGYDEILQRHILIYGVLTDAPGAFPTP